MDIGPFLHHLFAMFAPGCSASGLPPVWQRRRLSRALSVFYPHPDRALHGISPSPHKKTKTKNNISVKISVKSKGDTP